MKSPQTIAADSEMAESLSPIESDAESGSVRASYDRSRDPTSLAVVAVVATARGEDPMALAPLQTVVDTDALEKLTTGSPGAWSSVSFRYSGYEVTVTSEGIIEANPIENGDIGVTTEND